MTHMIQRRGATILVIVIGLLFLIVFGSFKASGSIALTGSTNQTSYTSSEPVHLTLHITNSSEKDICISNAAEGSVRIQSVTKDGAPVATRTTASYFITSLSEIIKSKLEQVAPGDSIAITLSSSHDPGLDAEAFYETALDDTSGITTFYNIQDPGTYEMELAYQYPGEASEACTDVFKGASNTATVSFTITSNE